jgi:hypothetical protein
LVKWVGETLGVQIGDRYYAGKPNERLLFKETLRRQMYKTLSEKRNEYIFFRVTFLQPMLQECNKLFFFAIREQSQQALQAFGSTDILQNTSDIH